MASGGERAVATDAEWKSRHDARSVSRLLPAARRRDEVTKHKHANMRS